MMKMDKVSENGTADVCDICGVESLTRRDVDMSTGERYGMLCPSCQSGLDYFGRNPKLIEVAVSYLEAHGK